MSLPVSATPIPCSCQAISVLFSYTKYKIQAPLAPLAQTPSCLHTSCSRTYPTSDHQYLEVVICIAFISTTPYCPLFFLLKLCPLGKTNIVSFLSFGV